MIVLRIQHRSNILTVETPALECVGVVDVGQRGPTWGSSVGYHMVTCGAILFGMRGTFGRAWGENALQPKSVRRSHFWLHMPVAGELTWRRSPPVALRR